MMTAKVFPQPFIGLVRQKEKEHEALPISRVYVSTRASDRYLDVMYRFKTDTNSQFLNFHFNNMQGSGLE